MLSIIFWALGVLALICIALDDESRCEQEKLHELAQSLSDRVIGRLDSESSYTLRVIDPSIDSLNIELKRVNANDSLACPQTHAKTRGRLG